MEVVKHDGCVCEISKRNEDSWSLPGSCNAIIQLRSKAISSLTRKIHRRTPSKTIWRIQDKNGLGPYAHDWTSKDLEATVIDQLSRFLSPEDMAEVNRHKKAIRYGAETFCQLMAWNYPHIAHRIKDGTFRIVKIEAKKVWRVKDWPQVIFIPKNEKTTKPRRRGR